MDSNNSAESRLDAKTGNLFSLITRNFWPLATVILVLAGSLAVIQVFKKPGQMSVIESQAMDMSAMVPPKGALPVAIARVSRESISGSVTYTGSAVAFEDEDIYPRIEGRLTQIPVYPGDRVRKGQLLVQLDLPQHSEYLSRLNEARYEAQAAEHDAGVARQEFKKLEYQFKASESAEQAAKNAVEEAQANFDYWVPELQREADMLKKQVISQQEYDNEVAQFKAAQAKLAQANAQLKQANNNKLAAQADSDAMMHHIGHRYAMSKEAEAKEQSAEIIDSYRRIVSSADGVVTKRVLSPGVLVSPGMLILKVAHINKIRLQAELANTDVDKLQVGAPVFYKPSDNGEERQATISSIFPAADPTSRTFIVEAVTDNLRANVAAPSSGNLPNLDRYLFLPGQYVVMRIVTGQAEGLTIPSRALVWKEGKAKVWKAVGGTASGPTTYTCVMHPEIKSDKAGKCPKCGMELVPEQKSGPLSAQLLDIKIGLSNAEKTEVLSGLAEGDQVIYEGQGDLQPGMAVVATEWGTNAPAKLPVAADLSDKRLSNTNNWTSTRSAGEISAKISMTPSPLKADSNSVILELQEDGKPLGGVAISGKSSMPAMSGMGGPDLHGTEKSPGHYEIGCNFASGLWEAKLELKPPGKSAENLTIEVEVP